MTNLADMDEMNKLDLEDRLMPGEAARILGVSTKTLTTMSELHPIVLPSGHRRYHRAEVFALASKSNGDRNCAPALAAEIEAVGS